MTLEAIVFDFDGVIADSEPLHLRAAQQALADHGLTLDAREYYARYLGFDDPTFFRHLAEDRGWPLDEDMLRGLLAAKGACFERLSVQGGVFPGAVECVRACAAAVPLAIASGAQRHEIEHMLERAGLRAFFQTIVASGDTPRSKPAPDPYRRAVELLDVAPACTVAIEDSRWGITSAQAAGLRCVGITHSYAADELRDADLVIDSLAELTVERLEGVVKSPAKAGRHNEAGGRHDR